MTVGIKKTRDPGLSNGDRMMLQSLVLSRYQRVTDDRWTDGRTDAPLIAIGCALLQHG